jgi:hypothetical protein
MAEDRGAPPHFTQPLWSNSMPDTTAEIVTEELTQETGAEVEPAETVDAEAEAALGDKGKKAIDAMKAERNAARAEAKATLVELEKLRTAAANADKPAEEVALENARKEGKAEATKASNLRVLKSELKAAATGKLADPADAALYINLDDFDVNEDGDTDSGALAEAIDELISRKPHLAAAAARKFVGDADQGGKGKPAVASQLTEKDLESMSPEAINKARREGRLNTLLGKN